MNQRKRSAGIARSFTNIHRFFLHLFLPHHSCSARFHRIFRLLSRWLLRAAQYVWLLCVYVYCVCNSYISTCECKHSKCYHRHLVVLPLPLPLPSLLLRRLSVSLYTTITTTNTRRCRLLLYLEFVEKIKRLKHSVCIWTSCCFSVKLQRVDTRALRIYQSNCHCILCAYVERHEHK